MQDIVPSEAEPRNPLSVLIFENNRKIQDALSLQMADQLKVSPKFESTVAGMLARIDRMSVTHDANPDAIVIDWVAEGRDDAGLQIFTAIRNKQLALKTQFAGKTVHPYIVIFTSSPEYVDKNKIAALNQQVYGDTQIPVPIVEKGNEAKLFDLLTKIRPPSKSALK